MEWKLLPAQELNKIDPQGAQWPWDTFAVVAMQDDKVVGRLVIRNMPVLEGWYVDPDTRADGVADELTIRAEEVLRTVCGATHAMCMSYDEAPLIRKYIHMKGFEDFPVKLHIKEIAREEKAA